MSQEQESTNQTDQINQTDQRRRLIEWFLLKWNCMMFEELCKVEGKYTEYFDNYNNIYNDEYSDDDEYKVDCSDPETGPDFYITKFSRFLQININCLKYLDQDHINTLDGIVKMINENIIAASYFYFDLEKKLVIV